MAKEMWLNFGVDDLIKSKEFYQAIGFKIMEQHANNNQMVGLVIGEQKVAVMLFPKSVFGGFIQNSVTNTSESNEVLISIDAASPEEVDALIELVEKAGGKVYGKPGWSQGWMYGAGFCDLDGHRWNILHMDMSKMPK
jgi:predicted lactoylglutathione lyase